MSSTTPELSPEYLNESNVTSLLTTCIVFFVLDTLFVVLRFFSRWHQRVKWGWDDTLMLGGWLTCVGLCIDGIIAPRFGVGTRFEKVLANTPEKIPHWGWNGFYAIPILYSVAVALPKMSVLLLYLRIFMDRFSKICCYTLLGIIGSTTIANIFASAFQCNKPTAAWDLTLPGRRCSNIQAHLTYGSLPNIVTDVAMLILPIPVVRRLKVSTDVKVGIYVTFLLASVGLITAIIRFVQFAENAYASDPTYKATPLIIWVVVETSIYLISGCLLSCKPVLRNLTKLMANNPLASVTEWLRESWNRSFSGSRSEPISTNNQSSVPWDNRRESSQEAFVVQGDSYRLEPTLPHKIHVQNEFSVKSSDANVKASEDSM